MRVLKSLPLDLDFSSKRPSQPGLSQSTRLIIAYHELSACFYSVVLTTLANKLEKLQLGAQEHIMPTIRHTKKTFTLTNTHNLQQYIRP